MLSFMEFWNGDILSDIITQTDMSNFRLKLASILLGHKENTRDWRHPKPSELIGNCQPSDRGDISDCVEIIPTPTKKMKLLNRSTDHEVNTTSSLCMTSIMGSLKTQYERMMELCKYIIDIDDMNAIQMEWVRSSSPYPIALTVEKLKDALRVEKHLHPNCFNMGVREIACHINQWIVDSSFRSCPNSIHIRISVKSLMS